MKHEDRPFDETEHDLKKSSFENVAISHNNNSWRVTGMLGFFGWNKPKTFLVTEIVPEHIEDPEDHEAFEIALDYWMREEGIDPESTTVQIGAWLK